MNELSDAMIRALEVLEGGYGLPALRTHDRGVNFGTASRLVGADLATYSLFGSERQTCLEITDKGREALVAHRTASR